mgnify:CR=1 FL=1
MGRKYNAFVVENCGKSFTHDWNADYKQNTLTYTLHTEKQWHYCRKKNNTNYVVTRIAILNRLLIKMRNLGGPALCLNGHKIVVAHEKFVMKILNKTSATVP